MEAMKTEPKSDPTPQPFPQPWNNRCLSGLATQGHTAASKASTRAGLMHPFLCMGTSRCPCCGLRCSDTTKDQVKGKQQLQKTLSPQCATSSSTSQTLGQSQQHCCLEWGHVHPPSPIKMAQGRRALQFLMAAAGTSAAHITSVSKIFLTRPPKWL